MSEVEKMYRNVGIESVGFNPYKLEDEYPPFTAEKQIAIIKWLLESYDIGLSQLGQRIDTSLDGANCISGLGSGDTFEESLAQAINDLWQDLTDAVRTQIKEILE